MGKKSLRLLNVKVSDDLRALIERATDLSGMRSMSEWMREALEAGARQEIAGHDRVQRGSPSGPGFLNVAGGGRSQRHLGMQVGHARCTHPPTAREQTVEAEVCGMCGTVTRWRV